MNKQKYVIVDIDGTVSIVGDRVRHLSENPCNWDEFYRRCGEDLPNEPIVKMVQCLIYDQHYEAVYMTGRRESERTTTMKWLQKHRIGSPYLFMRPDGDRRHDTEVKPELMDLFFKNTFTSKLDIAFILEDRNSMVAKWRELGYTCLQVADGNF